MAKTKQERWQDIHSISLREFHKVQTALRDVRLQCLQDRRFYSVPGAQWEGPLNNQFENKPKLEINKCHLSVIRVFNEYRNNKIDVVFSSADGDPTYDNEADNCSALYRADEKDSNAEEAFDNCYEEGVGGGFGAVHIRTQYEDESDPENERQRVLIDPIVDADACVFFDLQAKRYDKRDAKRCWVLYSYTYDAYEEEFGEDPATWPKIVHQHEFDWVTPRLVYVAAYYEKEQKREQYHVYQGLEGDEKKYYDKDFNADPELEEKLRATGYQHLRSRTILVTKVHKYLMSGQKILKDYGYIVGKSIPIVPFYAKRWFVDGIERCQGHVRLAKDAQRVKNILVTKIAEIAAKSSTSKPILTHEQMVGNEKMWAEDGVEDYPYLLVNSTKDAQGNIIPLQQLPYYASPDVPAPIGQLLSLTEQDIQDLLGNQQAGEELASHITGKVVELVQTRLDMQAFIYIDNFAKFKKRVGEIWYEQACEVYYEDNRKLKGLKSDGTAYPVTINKPRIDQDTGDIVYSNSPNSFKATVDTQVGPSSQSKRDMIVRLLVNMLGYVQGDPESLQIVVSYIMMNLDGEGISELREYFRKKLIKLGIFKPTDSEQKELQQEAANTPPDPNTLYTQAVTQEKLAATARQHAAAGLDTARAQSETANAVKTLHDAQMNEHQHALAVFEALNAAQQAKQSSS